MVIVADVRTPFHVSRRCGSDLRSGETSGAGGNDLAGRSARSSGEGGGGGAGAGPSRLAGQKRRVAELLNTSNMVRRTKAALAVWESLQVRGAGEVWELSRVRFRAWRARVMQDLALALP